jgi:hypothetical protein
MLSSLFGVKITINNRPNYVSVTGLFPYSLGLVGKAAVSFWAHTKEPI